MEYKRDFETVCAYAELNYKRRQGPSKAKDYTQTYYWNHWQKCNMMVLYEGEKRTLRGHDKPEVCWICIDEYGALHSVPSRHLRLMDQQCGFGFIPGVWEAMFDVLDWAEDRNYGKKNKG